jgi:two-component sensor histidine kinase/CHASE1-domain containing sensor protein
MLWPEYLSAAARRRLLIYAALPLAYVVCGRLGLVLAVPPGYATAVFLPAGVAVAAMFVAGAATVPGTCLGSFALNLWIGYSISHHVDATGVASALVIAVASALQAAIGGTVLRRLIGYPAPLDQPHELLLFLMLSPVICLTSATLSLGGLWLLGVVQSADLAMNWTTWWAGDALGVLVALPLMLVLVGEPRTLWRSRAGFVAVPMVLCFALFVAIFVRVSHWENEQSLLQFRMQSQQVADQLKANLEEQALFLEQLSSGLTSRNRPITRANFRALVQPLLSRFPTIQAIEWAPRVLAADRGKFETSQRAELPGFSIRDRDSSGQLQSAGSRDQLYPVTYAEPLAGNEEAVGFDLGSETNRQTAIGAAIESGRVTASAPIRLVQERGDQAGILLIYAVPNGPNGPGIVLVALRMGTVAAALTEPHRAAVAVKLSDVAGASLFFNSFPSLAEPSYESGFAFGARRYLVQTAPTAAYLAAHRGWQSWAVLAAGALGTGLLGGLLLLGTGHTYRLERLTDQLREGETRIAADLLAMTHLNHLSNRLVREGGEISKCLNEVVDTAIAISGADKGNVQLRDVGGALTIAAQRGFDAPFLTFFEHVRDDASACAAAMHSCERVIVEDVMTSDIFSGQPSQQVLIDAGVLAVISTPLKSSRENLLGMVSTHFAEPHRPTERELNLLDLLARQTADYLERKRAEETEKTLIREVQHRSNNLLAVIQSIAHRSLSGDYPLAEAKRAFEARLQALARANRQLTQSNWGGVNLNEIVRLELEPFADRTIVEGVNVTLGPHYAQNFCLALHELATNAAKYGALSSRNGRVEVSWTIAAGPSSHRLRFKWQEKGGPAIVAPTHRGFGTSLLKAAFEDVRFDYAREGLNCEIDLLLPQIRPGATDARSA